MSPTTQNGTTGAAAIRCSRKAADSGGTGRRRVLRIAHDRLRLDTVDLDRWPARA